jgi:hypothetical protein
MTLRTLQASLVVCTCLVVGACNKPALDPAEAAYGRAVTQFAALSAETKDLNYRDARFDQVLVALDQVPAGSEASDRARALAQRIRLARMTAEQADRRSQQELREATAPPVFVPGPKTETLERPPLKTPAESPPAGWVQAPALTVAVSPQDSSGSAVVPEWYRKAGYLPSPAAPPSVAAPAPASSDEQDMAQGQSQGKPDASARPPPGDSTSDAGWRIYGLPGPAGKALGGAP